MYRIADDLLITSRGPTKQEADRDHAENLLRLFERSREKNIELNKAKFELKCDEVSLIGHLLSKDGVTPKKIEAIVNMESATDGCAELRWHGEIPVKVPQQLVRVVTAHSQTHTRKFCGSGRRNKRPCSLSKPLLHRP